MKLSLQQARNLHLAAQGLLRPPAGRAQYSHLLACVRRMSLLQIDTIHVVARSPCLVLFSRLGAYPQSWLEQALAEGQLFEYWAHEACFIPREDYRLLRHRMLEPERLGWKYNAQWMHDHQQEITELLRHIEENGPVRAADFAAGDNHKPGWWSWKPHKRHLENLFSAGELMVSARRNFQRLYDLRTRILPEWNDALHALSENDARYEMLLNSARSLGIFSAGWLPDYYRLKHVPLKSFLEQAQQAGEIMPVEVAHLGEMWLHKDIAGLLDTPLKATHSAVLSPFDPVVWDRRRALALFSFDYRLECYTPEAKRRYGYFVLPVLHRGVIKARLDARMLRQAKRLSIKNFWLEPETRVTAAFVQDIRQALSRFAAWQGAETVVFEQMPSALAPHWPACWALNA